MLRCHLCGGLLALLGKLGHLVWFRCQDCGMDSSMSQEDFDDLEECGCCEEDS